MKRYWDSSGLIEALHDETWRRQITKSSAATRPHSLAEVFSTLTKGVNFRYDPDDAAKMITDLAADLEFVELTTEDTLTAIQEAKAQGVRGARVHDLMHATAAKKCGAQELFTLDEAGFRTLKLTGLKLVVP